MPRKSLIFRGGPVLRPVASVLRNPLIWHLSKYGGCAPPYPLCASRRQSARAAGASDTPVTGWEDADDRNRLTERFSPMMARNSGPLFGRRAYRRGCCRRYAQSRWLAS